jgi:di/tricarboxylate transporter
MGFRSRFGGLVFAIWRQGRPVRAAIRRVAIEPGDVLLVRMPPERVRQLSSSPDFIVLEQRPRVLRPRPRMLVPVAILALIVSLAATGVTHIAVAGTVGVVLMLAARVVPYDRLYAAVDWRTLVLIGSLIPLGTAIERSGLADVVVGSVTGWLEAIGPIGVLAGIFILTAVVTQIMSNAAAVVLVAPVALGIAAQLAIAPHPVMMMVAISGSTAFLTPIGHQANVLVYNAGGYRFVDFVRVGGPLTLLILLVSLVVVPLVWPL